jgi:hypothetical protein
MKYEPIQQLLETEMDRKEFLAYMGATALAVTGVSGLLKVLTQPMQRSGAKQPERTSGYGHSAYGR